MRFVDRVRIEGAVQRFDFWLDFRGVSRTRRRELRAELRGNLTDAAAEHGTTVALLGIGSPRTLAHDVAEASPARPRWAVGAYAALAFFVVLMTAWLFSVIGFVEGVEAGGATGRAVTGELFPWGGKVTAEVGRDGSGLSVSATVPWAIWIGSLVVLLVAAQPWRPLHRRLRPSNPAVARG